jgi:hypothetical protein
MEIKKMETKKVLVWWLLYNVLGAAAGVVVGFLGGFFGGFFAAILGLPESFAVVIITVVVIAAAISNFYIFKWAVSKLFDSIIK